jgi:hypothetical protein
MPREYARFAALPIGPGLVTGDGGLTLTTMSPSLDIQRAARSNVAHALGDHGAEFMFWGESALVAAIGLVSPDASLSAAVGTITGTVGWRLDAGTIVRNGSVQTSGLTIPAKGQIVSVRLRGGESSAFADFYLGSTLVHTLSIGSGEWHFAVSMASPVAGELFCAVNTGQWPVVSPAGRASWQALPTASPVFRLSDSDYLTYPADDPANTRYEAKIMPAGFDTLQAVTFWPWAESASQPSTGQFVVFDRSGAIATIDPNALVPVTVRMVDIGAPLSTAITLGQYVMDSVEVLDDARVAVRLRDPLDDMYAPINPGVFLPNVPALAWQPQPVVIGAVASVPLMAANSDATVGFLADSPIAHVDAVMDRGDLMEGGTWTLHSDSQQLLLESPPQGPMVADVSSVGPAAMTPATLEHALHHAMSRGPQVSAWSSADAAAIDTATGYAGIGFYVGGGVVAKATARDAMLASYTAASYRDADGVQRFVRLVDPDLGTASAELSLAHLVDDLTWIPDNAPALSRRMGYRPNAAPMSPSDFVTDLVDVPASRRVELMGQFRGIVYSAVPMARRYAAAERRDPVPSLFWHRADAQAELDRVCSLYAVERRFYLWRNAGDAALSLLPGQIVSLTYPLHGLEAGRNLLVCSVLGNRSTGRFTIRLWGQ